MPEMGTNSGVDEPKGDEWKKVYRKSTHMRSLVDNRWEVSMIVCDDVYKSVKLEDGSSN